MQPRRSGPSKYYENLWNLHLRGVAAAWLDDLVQIGEVTVVEWNRMLRCVSVQLSGSTWPGGGCRGQTFTFPLLQVTRTVPIADCEIRLGSTTATLLRSLWAAKMGHWITTSYHNYRLVLNYLTNNGNMMSHFQIRTLVFRPIKKHYYRTFAI